MKHGDGFFLLMFAIAIFNAAMCVFHKETIALRFFGCMGWLWGALCLATGGFGLKEGGAE